MIATFQYISSADSAVSQDAQIDRALHAGIRWIQLRMKNASMLDIESAIQNAIRSCKRNGAALIVNDYVNLAAKMDVKGVHIGLQDYNLEAARAEIGRNKILGVSAHSLDDIRAISKAAVADYIHLGPFRYTDYKAHAAPIIGVDGYWDIMRQCRREGLSIPILALGGIALKDVRSLMETGVYGIAATELVQESEDLEQLLHRLNWLINRQNITP